MGASPLPTDLPDSMLMLPDGTPDWPTHYASKVTPISELSTQERRKRLAGSWSCSHGRLLILYRGRPYYNYLYLDRLATRRLRRAGG
jgi:hypothetical protein